jgi:hypothetical protein
MASSKKGKGAPAQTEENTANAPESEELPSEAPPAEMPRFDFSDCELSSEEVAEAEKKEGGDWFKPGKHDVEIQSVEYRGPAKDPNWGKLSITLEGTGGKTIMDFPMIPFKTPVYKSANKDTMFPWKKFKGFCAGLGLEVTRDNVESVLKNNFADVKKLNKRKLTIQVGYQRGHVEGAGDGSHYKIVLQDGNDLVDSKTREVVLFSDRAAAHNYATENKLAVDKFTSVLSYEKAAPVSEGNTNW